MTPAQKEMLLKFFNDAYPLYERAAAGKMNARDIKAHYMEYGLCFHLRWWLGLKNPEAITNDWLKLNDVLADWLLQEYDYEPAPGKYYMFEPYKLTQNLAESIGNRLEVIEYSCKKLHEDLYGPEEEDYLCSSCGGSGEGPTDQHRCTTCKGSGVYNPKRYAKEM